MEKENERRKVGTSGKRKRLLLFLRSNGSNIETAGVKELIKR